MKTFDGNATIVIHFYDVEADSITDAIYEALESGQYEIYGTKINSYTYEDIEEELEDEEE